MPDILRAQSLKNGDGNLWQIERLVLDDQGRPVWEPLGQPVDNEQFRQLRPHVDEVLQPPPRRRFDLPVC